MSYLKLTLASALVCVGFAAAAAQNQNQNQNKQNQTNQGTNNQVKDGQRAKITNVDAKNGTVTVQMKDASGKESTRQFKLTEDIRYFDSTGKAVAIDLFRSGDEVLVVE